MQSEENVCSSSESSNSDDEGNGNEEIQNTGSMRADTFVDRIQVDTTNVLHIGPRFTTLTHVRNNPTAENIPRNHNGKLNRDRSYSNICNPVVYI